MRAAAVLAALALCLLLKGCSFSLGPDGSIMAFEFGGSRVFDVSGASEVRIDPATGAHVVSGEDLTINQAEADPISQRMTNVVASVFDALGNVINVILGRP